jgi:hypothetical protein
MASSSEAFEKFSIWKKRKTPLKVTVIVGGKTEVVFNGWILGLDSEAELIALALRMHIWESFDVGGATFSVEPTRVTATRNESDWIVFEES